MTGYPEVTPKQTFPSAFGVDDAAFPRTADGRYTPLTFGETSDASINLHLVRMLYLCDHRNKHESDRME
jgi:hypothetical protein